MKQRLSSMSSRSETARAMLALASTVVAIMLARTPLTKARRESIFPELTAKPGFHESFRFPLPEHHERRGPSCYPV